MSETTNLKLFKQDNPTTNTNNFDIEKTLNENWDKLDENAGSVNKKINNLEEANSEIKTDVDALKADNENNKTDITKLKETTSQNTTEIETIKQEQTTQNENIEKNAEGIAQNKKDVDEELTKIKKENSLLKSQIPEGHASGNNIHLGDSSNMPFECKPRGGSRQETTEGYNLLNVENDFKVTNLEANKVVEIHLKANVTYTIKCDEIETDNTELKSCLFRFQYDSADVANPYARIPIATKTTTYTPPEDINSVRIYSGTSHNESATTNTTFKNLMIYEGTENKPYEPYTGENPSPSLEYPSKIKNVENDVKVTVSNKNLYKIEKVINDTNYSKIIYKDENGNVSFTTGGIPLIIAPTKTKEKTEYTYILKCKSNVTTENNINFTGIYEDGTSELLSANKKKDTNEFIVKFKTNKEKTLAYVTQQYTNSARTTIITEGTMILEGDYLNLDEPYEIHQEQEIIFPLEPGQKLYKGSYLAEDEIHNIRRQDILTGEESLQNYHSDTSNGFVVFSFIMSRKHKKNADFLCTHLTKNGENVYYNRGLGGWLPDEDKWCYICVPISILKDVSTAEKQIESMKEYLTEQYNAGTPMKFEYEIATEEIIPYTQEQQAVIDKILYTYKNVTNISVDDELATLDITYKKDIETMFNNQAKEYNERLSNIENLLNTTETSALLLDNLENDLKEEV
nr:MAG TPA: protein UspA1 parallel alpha-helical coiled-coil [Caudoviricetes sp.]